MTKQSPKSYFISICTNSANTVLYTGITNNLVQRIYQHKEKYISSFTSKYRIHKLVYFEIFLSVTEAIVREKQIKAGSRKKKIDLIQKMNPTWEDLYLKII